MGSFSKALLNMLTEFMVREIDSKAIDGITYALFISGREQKKIDKYREIKSEALRCGYSNDQVLRVYELCNGYIFDMDINVVKKITSELVKSVSDGDNYYIDLIENGPRETKDREIKRLYNYIKRAADSGRDAVEIALFNTNDGNRAVVTGRGPDGAKLSLTYNAFKLRHWDIEEVNSEYLIKDGYRISKLEAVEILPSKKGVRVVTHIEKMQ